MTEAAAVRQLAAAQILPSLNAGLNFDVHTGPLQQASGNILKVNRDALYLGGSTVVPESRGRGVYRALLRRRWEDARQHGAKAMVIQAGALSRPVVERIGFEHVCDVRVYVDLV